MRYAEQIRLMHAVLDGEATPAQARDLERLLATDAGARTEFEELKRLFDALDRLPHAYPPEGLVAAITTAVAQQRQLFSQSCVIAEDASETRDAIPDSSTRFRPTSGPFPYPRGESMTNKRKIWFGAGIAAAIGLIAISSGVIDFPKSGDNTAGTIAPAQRWRGPPTSAPDVKPGDPATPGTAVVVPAVNNAAQNSAENSAKDSAKASAQDSAKVSAHDSAKVSAQASAKDSAQASAKDSAKVSAQDSAKVSAQASAKDSAQASAKDSAKVSAQDSAKVSAQASAKDSAKASAQDSAKVSAQASAKDSAKVSVQASAKDSAQASAQDSAKVSAQASAKDSAKASAQDSAKAAAQASARDAAKDSAKDAAKNVIR
jgi:chemotaxis protein histidine kinase CheA